MFTTTLCGWRLLPHHIARVFCQCAGHHLAIAQRRVQLVGYAGNHGAQRGIGSAMGQLFLRMLQVLQRLQQLGGTLGHADFQVLVQILHLA